MSLDISSHILPDLGRYLKIEYISTHVFFQATETTDLIMKYLILHVNYSSINERIKGEIR